VDSSVLSIEIYPEPLIPNEYLDRFFKLIKAGFSQKRKMLRNSLSSGLSISSTEAADLLTRAGIDPQRRAETLSIDEWRTLCETK
jgi:16S rRNA (adenine1518-N6/adenine1519-N6)-dimethyltransferase